MLLSILTIIATVIDKKTSNTTTQNIAGILIQR